MFTFNLGMAKKTTARRRRALLPSWRLKKKIAREDDIHLPFALTEKVVLAQLTYFAQCSSSHHALVKYSILNETWQNSSKTTQGNHVKLAIERQLTYEAVDDPIIPKIWLFRTVPKLFICQNSSFLAEDDLFH